MAFRGLPYVESCCFFVYDLRIATLFVILFNLLCVAWTAITRVFFPLCQDVHGKTLFMDFIIYGLEWMFLGAGVVMAFGMAILLITAVTYVPKPEVFIVSIFLVGILDILTNILNAMEIAPRDHGCKVTMYAILFKFKWLNKFYMIAYTLEAFFKAAVNMYFAAVVNSYAEQAERRMAEDERLYEWRIKPKIIESMGH